MKRPGLLRFDDGAKRGRYGYREEAKRDASLTAEEAKRGASLTEEQAKRDASLTEEEAKRDFALAEGRQSGTLHLLRRRQSGTLHLRRRGQSGTLHRRLAEAVITHGRDAGAHPYFVPITETMTDRSALAARCSYKNSPCHVPSDSFPAEIGMDSEVRVSAIRIWLGISSGPSMV